MFLGVWCWSQSLSLENLACAARSDSRDTSFVHFWPLRDGMPTRLFISELMNRGTALCD